jgi:biotin carboxyl carrier protein
VRYHVTLEPHTKSQAVAIDVAILESGGFQVSVDGRLVDVDVAVAGAGHQLSVRVDGKVVDLCVQGQPPEFFVAARGVRRRVRVDSDRTFAETRAPAWTGARGQSVVRSPMPGRVVRVLVARGDSVRVNQSLVVLEAMKMENEVRAASAGVIAEVHAIAGSAVEANAKLVTMELE